MRRRTTRTARAFRDLEWDGRAKSWPRRDIEPMGPPGGDLNLWMCAEDLGTEIWSHFHPRNISGPERVRPALSTNCSAELNEELAEALPWVGHGHDLVDVIGDFAKIVAQELMLTGPVRTEIQTAALRSEPHAIVQVRLASIPQRSVLAVSRLMFQFVPSDIATEQHSASIVRLDSSRIVTFGWPQRLRSIVPRIQNGFRVLGELQNQWMHEAAEGALRENAKEVRRNHEIQLGRLAAPIGWNFRGLLRDYESDFHWALRELRWKRTAIEVRDEILAVLSSALTVMGRFRGGRPALSWSDLPNVQQVDDAMNQLLRGARFNELMKPFL